MLVHAERGIQEQGDAPSRGVLEAFFYGRALAEVVNERLGAAAVQLFSEVGKFAAEFDDNLRDLQMEVQRRAQMELSLSAGLPLAPPSTSMNGASGRSSSAQGGGGAAEEAADLREIVDDLRAEVAAARAQVQQYKNKLQGSS